MAEEGGGKGKEEGEGEKRRGQAPKYFGLEPPLALGPLGLRLRRALGLA